MDKVSGKDKLSRRHKDSDHHHKHRSSKNKSGDDDDDKHRWKSERENDRERRERSYESRVLDEKLSKRKERGGSEEERFDEKRVRVSDEYGEERGKREERRMFWDKVKEEEDVDVESKRGGIDEVLVKREVKNEEVNGNRNGAGGSVADGAGLEPLNMAILRSVAPADNPKVSSIYTTEITKLKSQFGQAQAKELKAKQAQLAKAKAEPDINPNLIDVSERVILKEKPKEPIPEVEWWDAPLLLAGNYDDICDAKIAGNKSRMEKITIYVEHPWPTEPPAEPAPPPPQPLKLTKKEQKKLRTQRRLARQEMIRQGLIEPPNTLETLVSVYKINNLSHPRTRFKVDVNAQENGLTGCAVICDGITVVVVEGGSKAIKRYGKLMLKQIDWAAAVQDEDEYEDEAVVNKCVLVWQGSVAELSFNRFSVHKCRSQAEAHRVFCDAGVHHYWDLSVNFTEE